MKTVGVFFFAAALIFAGAASAHPHFTPPDHGGLQGQNSDSDKSTGGIVTGYDTIGKSTQPRDGDTIVKHHEWRKDLHRERVAHRLEVRLERLKMEIEKLKLDLSRGVGNPDLIKREIARLDRESVKVDNALRWGDAPA